MVNLYLYLCIIPQPPSPKVAPAKYPCWPSSSSSGTAQTTVPGHGHTKEMVRWCGLRPTQPFCKHGWTWLQVSRLHPRVTIPNRLVNVLLQGWLQWSSNTCVGMVSELGPMCFPKKKDMAHIGHYQHFWIPVCQWCRIVHMYICAKCALGFPHHETLKTTCTQIYIYICMYIHTLIYDIVHIYMYMYNG